MRVRRDIIIPVHHFMLLYRGTVAEHYNIMIDLEFRFFMKISIFKSR